MTTGIRSVLSRDFLACTDPPLDMLSIGFSHATTPVILGLCHIKIFVCIKLKAKSSV